VHKTVKSTEEHITLLELGFGSITGQLRPGGRWQKALERRFTQAVCSHPVSGPEGLLAGGVTLLIPLPTENARITVSADGRTLDGLAMNPVEISAPREGNGGSRWMACDSGFALVHALLLPSKQSASRSANQG